MLYIRDLKRMKNVMGCVYRVIILFLDHLIVNLVILNIFQHIMNLIRSFDHENEDDSDSDGDDCSGKHHCCVLDLMACSIYNLLKLIYICFKKLIILKF